MATTVTAGTAGVTRVTTDWQGQTAYSAATTPNDGVTPGTAGAGYASDGSIGYIPSIWAGKLIER